MAEPALRLCADAGLSFETTERSLLVPCANAPVDLLLVRPERHPRVRPGRGRRRRDHRRQPGRGGAGGRRDARRARLRALHARGGGARGRVAAGGRGPRRAPRRDRLSRLDAASCSRRAGVTRRARPGVRVGRGDAAAGAGGRDRRSRLDRIDDGRERAAPGRRAARVAGGAGRRARGRPTRRELVERLGLMLSGVVAARRRRYVMMNATGRGAAGDSRRAAEHGCADGAAPRRRGADRGSRCGRRRRHLVGAPGAEGGGRVLDPRHPGREARPVRAVRPRRGDRRSAAPIVADVRERGDDALLSGRSGSTGRGPEGFRVPAPSGSRCGFGRRRVLEARCAAMIAAVRTFSEAQRPRDTIVEAAPGDRLRAALGRRSTPSACACRAAVRRSRPRSS